MQVIIFIVIAFFLISKLDGCSDDGAPAAESNASGTHQPEKSIEQIMREDRARALMQQAEADNELRKYANETRQEYINKAIRHQSHSSGGVTIDSFELPGDVFIACTLSHPGPVYSCDETATFGPK